MGVCYSVKLVLFYQNSKLFSLIFCQNLYSEQRSLCLWWEAFSRCNTIHYIPYILALKQNTCEYKNSTSLPVYFSYNHFSFKNILRHYPQKFQTSQNVLSHQKYLNRNYRYQLNTIENLALHINATLDPIRALIKLYCEWAYLV